MVLNPCPCMSLQRGSMILAVVDAIISMLNFGLMVLALIAYIHNDDRLELTESERTAGIIVAIILIIICVLQILLAVRLYVGARSKDYRNCRIWLMITAVLTGLNIGNFIVNVVASEFNGVSFGGSVTNIIYKIYEIIVVYQFVQELKLERQLGISSYATTAQPQPPPPYSTLYTPENAAPIYVTPQSASAGAYPMQQYSSNAYPMQQFAPPPNYAPRSNGYPAPVHHVATTVVS